jgi:uncharacterized glyoxalase superfamily protein PhnB
MANLAPWLSVSHAPEALTFYTAAFAAVELERLEDDAGDVVVAQTALATRTSRPGCAWPVGYHQSAAR